MNKLTQTALIAAVVLALSLIAAWLFDGSDGRLVPEQTSASEAGPTMPVPVSVRPLTAPTPLTAPRPPRSDPTAKGLAWLAKEQHPDGHWDLSPGRTGLALVAFLSAGESHLRGSHRRAVRNGLKFLKQIQNPDGFFVLPNTPRSNRDHAIATLAMAEAYAIAASPLFKQSAEQGIEAIPPFGDLDKLTSRWVGIALHSAKGAGLRAQREDSARIDLTHLGLWRPTSMTNPTSHYFGSWYAASIRRASDQTWRWDFREVAAGRQEADGSFKPGGRYRQYLGRVGTTALMTAATAMTFWL